MEKLDTDVTELEGEISVFVDKGKDSRWQLVYGWKNKKYRVLDAYRKLTRTYKRNENNVENPIQCGNRNLPIKKELDRLSEFIDYCNEEMKKVIADIHKDVHK